MEYIVNDCKNPYFNLALEEYLFKLDDEETYFWLWQNDNTIVIGKNQNAFQEVDFKFVQKNGIKVARRITGGGAVYHDLGNLNFTFITPSYGKRNYDFKQFTDKVSKALEVFGIKAEYSGRNDLLIDGKKFSGNAQFVGDKKVLHHGTLLFSTDLSIIGKCLTPPKEKLKSHGVASVQSRVTMLSEYLDIGLEEFKNELVNQMCENANIHNLSQEEIDAVQNLCDTKFSTYEWIYGASPEFNYSKSVRFEGCGTINLSMNLKSGEIENCKITGDFFGTGDVSELEGLLCGKENVHDVIETVDLDHYFGNLRKEDFLLLFEN